METKESDVLFQKIGAVWYVFSEMEGELIYSTLPQGLDPYNQDFEFYQLLEEHMERVAKSRKDLAGPTT